MTNDDNFTFRLATVDDIKRIESWYNHIDGSQFLSHFIPSVLMNGNKLFTGVLRWFIVLNDECEIGTIWLEQKDQNVKELDLGIFFNNENLMGKGYGKSIIKKFIANQNDLLEEFKLCLNVRMNNQRAIRCYQSIGFRITDKRQKISGLNKIDCFRMQLKKE